MPFFIVLWLAKQHGYRRGLFYALSAVMAFVWVPLAWAGLILVPLFYFVPHLSREESREE